MRVTKKRVMVKLLTTIVVVIEANTLRLEKPIEKFYFVRISAAANHSSYLTLAY